MAIDNTRKVYTIGLKKIESGDIAQDGGMGSTLTEHGYTYQDSATLSAEDPTQTEFYAEEVDDPVVVLTRAGKITIKWSVMNPSTNDLVYFMGGTIGSDGEYNAPNTQARIEKSLKISASQGYTLSFPRVDIVGKPNYTLSKSGIFLIDVTATVLTPTKDNTSKMTLLEQTT